MTPPTDTDRRAPWEIEIRDSGSRPPAPGPDRSAEQRRGTSGRLAVLALLGLACFGATVALLGWLTGDGEDDTAGEAAPTSAPITFAPREDAATITVAPTTSSTSTTSSTTTSTTAPPTTTTAASPASGTGSVPALSSSFGGGWVAMLTSVPYSSGTARLEAAYAEVRRVVPQAVAARGDDWASLGDGYWVLVRTGFGTAAEVRSFCADADTSRTDCSARELRRG